MKNLKREQLPERVVGIVHGYFRENAQYVSAYSENDCLVFQYGNEKFKTKPFYIPILELLTIEDLSHFLTRELGLLSSDYLASIPSYNNS